MIKSIWSIVSFLFVCLFKNFFKLEDNFNIVLVSALHQHEHSSHLPSHTSPLGCHRAPDLISLHHTANSQWLSVLQTVMYMFQCYYLKSYFSFFPLLCPKVCSLCLHLLCCPANLFISAIILNFTLYVLIRAISPVPLKVIIDRYVLIAILTLFSSWFCSLFLFIFSSFSFLIWWFSLIFMLELRFFLGVCESIVRFWFLVTLVFKNVNPQ